VIDFAIPQYIAQYISPKLPQSMSLNPRVEEVKPNEPHGMTIVKQKCCLQNKPMVVTVIENGQATPIYVNTDFLNVCKHRIVAGQSAELYKDAKFLMTFTRISDHVKLINLQQHYGDQTFQVRTLNVCGDTFNITKQDASVRVYGLENIAKNVVMKEFHMPSITFKPPDATPRINSMTHALAAIKQMNLSVHSCSLKNNPILQDLCRSNVVNRLPNNKRELKPCVSGPCENEMSTILDIHTARNMLCFNNNAISRFRSLFCHLPIDFSRNVCLNVALGHAGDHPISSIFIAHTLQHAPAPPNLIQSLQAVSVHENNTVIKYLDSNGNKAKAHVFEIPVQCQNLLRENSIDVRKGVAYMAIGLDGTPILIADLNMNKIPVYGSSDLVNFKGDFQTYKSMENDLQRRLLIYSISVNFPRLQAATPVLINAATHNKNVFPTLCLPALDTWACKRALAS
tara:strand:- start:2061 stop:3425 length:1365 start_codon:yes stop_codon:yes gene_type:complete